MDIRNNNFAFKIKRNKRLVFFSDPKNFLMAEPNENVTISSPKKDGLFWSKIIATQYLIRHPFWKSFSLPIIIGQASADTRKE